MTIIVTLAMASVFARAALGARVNFARDIEVANAFAGPGQFVEFLSECAHGLSTSCVVCTNYTAYESASI